jgi:hypothetical protein
MRFSTTMGAAGFDFWCVEHIDKHNFFRVFLDGVEQKRVEGADDEAGYVIRDKLDAAGNFVVEDGCWAVEFLQGKVEIKIEPQQPPQEGWYVEVYDPRINCMRHFSSDWTELSREPLDEAAFKPSVVH